MKETASHFVERWHISQQAASSATVVMNALTPSSPVSAFQAHVDGVGPGGVEHCAWHDE